MDTYFRITLRKPKRVLLLITCQMLIMAPLSAQNLMKLSNRCDYFDEISNSETFAFPPDDHAIGLVQQILALVEFKQNFELEASNVVSASAGLRGQQRVLLYSQYLFSSDESENAKWIKLAIFAHQIGHHVNHHILSREASTRREMELEADRFSAYVLYKMGASVEQAALALGSNQQQNSKLYPSRSSRVDAVIEVWNAAKSISDNYGPTVAAEIPRFQWPPPKPSGMADVPTTLLIQRLQNPTLFDVAFRLETALEAAGYSERTYYSVPEGFALVSRLEQIDDTGEAKTGFDRWSIDMKPPRAFTLRSYISSLLTSNPGRYRVIAFIVTSRPLFAVGASPDFDVSKDWLWGGANKLPSSVKNLRFTSEYSCTTLIYEFERSSPQSRTVLKQPGSLTGKDHLKRAMIWSALGGS